MCGIVGYLGKKQALPILLQSLYKLEYRGYDSSGIVLHIKNDLKIFRKKGKIKDLELAIGKKNFKANSGIGHTRWATHGKPSDRNAHPHTDCKGSYAVVHNGIIENFHNLREYLIKKGHILSSETDTEIIAHLLEEGGNSSPLESLKKALKKIQGYYALGVIHKDFPDKIWVARYGPPLILGIGDGDFYIASDYNPILPFTKKVLILEDGDFAQIGREGIKIFSKEGKEIERKVNYIDWDPVMAEKGGFKHFMLKEIFEQSEAIRDTISTSLSDEKGLNLEEFNLPKRIKRILIVACGTSLHSGLLGKFYIENLAKIPVEVDYASELRYRNPIIDKSTLILGISQSGETADTIASLKMGKEKGALIYSICNVKGSQIDRLSDRTFITKAGPEIGVASTKAFTTQLLSLFLISLQWRKQKGEDISFLLEDLQWLPVFIEKILKKDQEIQELAKIFFKRENFLYLGRGLNYPIALEGALKLKEISYIHAEGYPAGEMKHGPIALIDENMPVVAIATEDDVKKKMVANMEEVKSRDGILIGIINEGDLETKKLCSYTIEVPKVNFYLQPILNVVPLQLLAYHIALKRGCDVDQPRNLAKSVTVE